MIQQEIEEINALEDNKVLSISDLRTGELIRTFTWWKNLIYWKDDVIPEPDPGNAPQDPVDPTPPTDPQLPLPDPIEPKPTPEMPKPIVVVPKDPMDEEAIKELKGEVKKEPTTKQNRVQTSVNTFVSSFSTFAFVTYAILGVFIQKRIQNEKDL